MAEQSIQKAATIIALVVCLAVAVVGEVWEPTHAPQSPHQNSAAQQNQQSAESAQERPEEVIARYNRYLAYFTAILAMATIGLGFGTICQIRLARADFIATHRPKIRIRRVVFKRANTFQSAAIGTTFEGIMEVANIGSSRAIIKESDCRVLRTDRPLSLSDPYDIEEKPQEFAARAIEPGSAIRVNFESAINITKNTTGVFENTSADNIISDIAVVSDSRTKLKIYVLGWVRYADENHIVRKTAFCRLYRESEGRFVRVYDRDFEYED